MKAGVTQRTFVDCVRACAQDEKLVVACNRLHGTDLRWPIEALLEPDKLPNGDSEHAAELVCFIGFVHHQVWSRVLVARRRKASWAARRQVTTERNTGPLIDRHCAGSSAQSRLAALEK